MDRVNSSPTRVQGARHGPSLLVATLLALAASAGTTRAQAAVDLRGIDPELTTLPFGKGFDAIAQWLGKRIDRNYAARMTRAVETRERADLRAQRDAELEVVKNDEVIFDGRRTGLEHSIVAGEFGVNTGESLFRYKEGEETHYFFMHEGRLWKYLRVLGPAPSFVGRMAIYQRALGEPIEMGDEPDGEGGRRLVSTTWRRGGHDLRLVNRRIVYGADVFIVEDRATASALTETRKRLGQQKSKGYESIEIYFLDDPYSYGAPPPAPPPEPEPKKRPNRNNRTDRTDRMRPR